MKILALKIIVIIIHGCIPTTEKQSGRSAKQIVIHVDQIANIGRDKNMHKYIHRHYMGQSTSFTTTILQNKPIIPSHPCLQKIDNQPQIQHIPIT